MNGTKRKNLVLTLSIGEKYKEISFLTHETFKAYAEKIEADFLVLDEQEISETIQWEKFRIYDLLNQYERIIYLDSDIIIRDDCPNLFDVVPYEKMGMFDESPFIDRQIQMINCSLKRYYNTGVMVVSRVHKHVFEKPEKEINDFYEQTYLNTVIKDKDIFKLNYRFNRMCCMDGFFGISRLDSYIVHYAGCPSLNLMCELISKDLLSWSEDAPDYKYMQRIHITVSGGMGDQLCAQPAVRHMRKLLPDAEIYLSTHFPKFFEIEGVKTFAMGEFVTLPDTAYRDIRSFPDEKSVVFSVVSPMLSHLVDYCSISLIKRVLAKKDKKIELKVDLDSMSKVLDVVGLCDIGKLTLIHAGNHWETKTMPHKWWEEIIDGLISKSVPVCLIGKSGEIDGKTGEPGVLKFQSRDGMIDAVDLLDINGLIALISCAKCLVTNDSGPLHIAGAFEKDLIFIPTVKHPEHVAPYREKKSIALYKKLLLDDYNTSPFIEYTSTVDKMKYDWDRYLVEPSKVIERVHSLYSLP